MIQFSNKHDQRRVDKALKTLRKAKEQLELADRYLYWNNRPVDEQYRVSEALEGVTSIIEVLTGEEEPTDV